MATKIWTFKQKEYIEKYGLKGQEDGVCLALSARWAKMRLKKPGQVLDQVKRTNYFEKAPKIGKRAVATVIADMQEAYDTVRVPVQEQVKELDTQVEAIFDQYMEDKISFQDYERLKAPLEQLAEVQGNLVSNALDQLLARQHLHVVRKKNCSSFQDFFKDVQDKACYVFKCFDLKHAFAGYFVERVIWDDFYLFDPNSGEFYMDGSSEMEQFMAGVRNVFGVAGRAERYQVAYTPG